MNNTTWQDETVQALKQGYQSQIDELTVRLENANIAATSLQIQNIKLIRGSEAMQADAVNNTATIKMLMAQLAEQVEENRGLRQMLHMEPR